MRGIIFSAKEQKTWNTVPAGLAIRGVTIVLFLQKPQKWNYQQETPTGGPICSGGFQPRPQGEWEEIGGRKKQFLLCSFLKLDVLIICVSGLACMYVCTTRVLGALGDQKRALNPPELE